MMSAKELFKSEGTKMAAKSFGYGVAAMTLGVAATVLWPVSVVASGAVSVGAMYCAVHSDNVRKKTEIRTGQSLWKQYYPSYLAGLAAGLALAYMLTPSTAQIQKTLHLTPKQKTTVSLLAPAPNQGASVVAPRLG